MMIKNSYEFETHQILAFFVAFLMYLDLWVQWQAVYWYDLELLQQYINLMVAAEQVAQKSGWSWLSVDIWLPAVHYLLPLLLFFNRIPARIAFYVLFVVLYYFPAGPYETVTVVGLVDTSIYTFVMAGIGVLLASDINRFLGDSSRVSLFMASNKMKVLTFSVAVLVVLVSFFMAQDSRLETLEMAHLVDNTLQDSVRLSMPAIQAVAFLLLAAGIFISTKKEQLICIVLSWLALAYSGDFRLEWLGYYSFADLYALCSGILLWQALTSKESTLESGAVQQAKHDGHYN